MTHFFADARRTIIPVIVERHADEAAMLHDARTMLAKASHVKLRHLARFDLRLAAHLDGLSVAGEHAWPFCEAALDVPSVGAVFTAAIRAIEGRQQQRLDQLFALTEANPVTVSGLTSAFGWLEGEQLQGIVAGLLDAPDPLKRAVGIAACAIHRVEPGLVSARRLQDPNPEVRARALRAAGELGFRESLSACVKAIADEHPACQFWAAWSAVLLGNRTGAVEALIQTGLTEGAHRARAFRLALQAMRTSAAHQLLQKFAADPQQLRWLIQGSGIAGDAVYVPWLIKRMTDDQAARVAGEAFSLITGVDLHESGLEREPSKDFESGPNDDPNDTDVEMDPDDGLPWPDVEKIEKWWAANASLFQNGTRYFIGAPVTREHCIDVLKEGYQRQRILAAHYLCLLEPGTPLFNTSAPARRQQRLLAKMT